MSRPSTRRACTRWPRCVLPRPRRPRSTPHLVVPPAHQRLKGPIGLFLTSHDPTETREWFRDFSRPCYARTNQRAPRAYALPAGPIRTAEGETFPHSMEPQLRACGLNGIKLVRGVPSLGEEVVVCREGEKLTAEKARLLSLLGEMMAVRGGGIEAFAIREGSSKLTRDRSHRRLSKCTSAHIGPRSTGSSRAPSSIPRRPRPTPR